MSGIQRFFVSKRISNVSGPLIPNAYAIGGIVTEIGGYRIHTFNSVGTSLITFSQSGQVEYLIVAGGGGGSHWVAGGGGAGGMLSGNTLVNISSYSLVVGAGGFGSVAGTPGADVPYTNPSTPSGYGQKGSNSTGLGLICYGGGGGPGYNTAPLATYIDGGSGAGKRGSNIGNAGQGTVGQGNNGGGSNASATSGGGGGGAGSIGSTATGGSGGGNGGSGLTSTLSGTSTFYAGGGGGGVSSGGTSTTGGSSVGGQGNATVAGGNAVANTGSGGGSTADTTSFGGGNGSSGIIIIRYPVTLF